MATRAVVVTMTDAAMRRIAAAEATLGERFGVAPMPPPAYEGRDPAFNQARQLERLADLLDGIVAATDGMTAAPPADVADETDGGAESDLEEMSRAQLNAYAAELGIEAPDKLPNKAAVVAAIEETLTAPDDEAGTEDTEGEDEQP